MKKEVEKVIAASLAIFVITALSLTGCVQNVKQPSQKVSQNVDDNFNATGYPIVKEKITLKVMGAKAPIHGAWEDLRFFTEMEKKTNIKFEFKTPPQSNFTELKNIAIASNELPDIFLNANLNQGEEVEYGSSGTIIPLEGLIEQYAPNIKELFEKKPDAKKAITTFDGHIYSLAKVTDIFGRSIAHKLWFNSEWLKNLNVTKLPETTDELYQLLVRFRDEDPNRNGVKDEIPLSSSRMFALREIMLSYFGHVTREFEVKDNKVDLVVLQPGYKHFIEFAKKLYSEKLLDNEVFSQTTQQWTAKGKDNKVGLSFHASPSLIYTLKDVNDSSNFVALGPLTSEYNKTKTYPKASDGYTRGAFAITNACKNPEAAIRWVDYLYSEEGSIFAFMTDSWKWTDDSKTKWEFVNPAGGDNEEYRGKKLTPDTGGILPQWSRESFVSKQNSIATETNNKVTKELFDGVARLAIPKFYFSKEEQEEINKIAVDMFSYIEQMEAKFITGMEPMDNWDSFINNINKIGAKKLIDIYNKAYENYKNIK